MKCLHHVVKPHCKRKHANVQCTVHWCSCQCDRANNSVFSEQAMYTESAMWSSLYQNKKLEFCLVLLGALEGWYRDLTKRFSNL